MQRVCFVLQVKPDRLEEYKRRHREVWPDMQAALRETGWGNYSLFLRDDGLLVGYLETDDFERARAGMAQREVNDRWQREMGEFFVQLNGVLPDRAMQPLEEVFPFVIQIEEPMIPNPALGVFFHWLGGLASASFYVPYRGVKNWAWETYWLVGGFFSWIIVPWILALTMTSDLAQVLREAPASSVLWTYIFGVLWGLGGLTFGLTMRYLGMSLGMAVALGYTAAFGTLMPPIFRGEFSSQVLGTRSGLIILAGVAVCLLGIAFAGAAGVSKEREMSEAQKRASIKEFDLKKGLLVATFSGVMSACFAYGLAAGDPIKAITLQHGTTVLWQGLPVLVVVLAGGFTTNFIWCVILNVRNRTGYQYFQSAIRDRIPARSEEHILETVTDAPAEEMAIAVAVVKETGARAPMLANYLFAALAGTTWYLQFFFYTMGETQMGRYKFSSWTLHMASIIIFSTLWGIALKEWTGAGSRTKVLVAFSLLVLVASTVVVGYGNYAGGAPK